LLSGEVMDGDRIVVDVADDRSALSLSVSREKAAASAS
jgi:hypothetical protein